MDSSFQTDAAKMALHHNRTDQSEWNLINHFQNVPIVDILSENKVQVPFWKTIFNDSDVQTESERILIIYGQRKIKIDCGKVENFQREILHRPILLPHSTVINNLAWDGPNTTSSSPFHHSLCLISKYFWPSNHYSDIVQGQGLEVNTI